MCTNIKDEACILPSNIFINGMSMSKKSNNNSSIVVLFSEHLPSAMMVST